MLSFRVYLIHVRIGNRYAHTVDVAFDSQAAAKLWAERHDYLPGSYEIVAASLLTAADVESIWPR